MIKIINPELFKLETTVEKSENGNYFKTLVSSAIKVSSQKNGEKINRNITTIFSGEEDYNSNNVGIRTVKGQNGSVRVSINSSENNTYDTNIYLIAIPFNGFIEEIEKSFQYRIYRGIMVKADKRTIEFNGKTYKKIVYMIVVPNEKMLDENHKYHEDELQLKISSYNLETKEDGTTDTLKTTDIIKFTAPGEFSIDSEQQVVDPVNPDDFRGKTIFPFFIKEIRDDNSSNNYDKNLDESSDSDNNGKPHNKKSKKAPYYNQNPYERMKKVKKKTKRR